MQATLEPKPDQPTAAAMPPVLVVLDGRGADAASASVQALLRARFPGRASTVLVTGWANGEVVVRAPDAEPPPAESRLPPGGDVHPLPAVLRAALQLQAPAVALVAAAPHDDAADWLGGLLSPVLERDYDFVRPAYLRYRGEAAINTGIVYPLTRALYGRSLRQPLGGEAALSLAMAQRVLNDLHHDSSTIGSDAWLIAHALSSDARVCEAWLGAWPQFETPPEDVSQTLARVLGMVFQAMERHAEYWQRIIAPTPIDSFGTGGLLEGGSAAPVDRFVAAFQLGERELAPVWGLVLPPATRVLLRRAAVLSAEQFRLDDATWARIVYDFAVAWYARLVERRQLLLSMTPLYLGWAASFLNDTRALDAAATEARVDRLCAAFEREKRYLISRWRWPDGFTP